jgi:glycosyltransferase involved in cell wall biosynthesis
MRESIVFCSEPLLDPRFVQYQVLAPLAERLARDFDVAIAAPAIGPAARADLARRGIEPLSAGRWNLPLRNPRDEVPSFVLSWMRDALVRTNGRWSERALAGRRALRINYGMTNSGACDIWYVQSQPLAESVRMLAPNFHGAFGVACRQGASVIDLLDAHHIRATAARARRLYASTRHVADAYRRRGFRLDGQIPFYVYNVFSATTNAPDRDYALVYLGKETDMAAVRALIELGVPLKLFGGKSAELVQGALGSELPRHVEMLGRVSTERLRELYTHALFTAFPFTDESFGLVPLESMACGTPVLTYARQGPAETVVDGFTGWLTNGPTEFLEAARRLFHRGYPSGMQSACVERAGQFSFESVAAQWRGTIRAEFDGDESPASVRRGVAHPAHFVQSFLPTRELIEPLEPGGFGSIPRFTPGR